MFKLFYVKKNYFLSPLNLVLSIGVLLITFGCIDNSKKSNITFFGGKIKNPKGEILILPAGSTLPNFDQDTGCFYVLNYQYELMDEFAADIDLDNVCRQFLNAPYLWGGKNPFGIDCSGLTQIVTKILGKQIPRDANQQVNSGVNINFISDAVPGDLAFFDDEEDEEYEEYEELKNNFEHIEENMYEQIRNKFNFWKVFLSGFILGLFVWKMISLLLIFFSDL